MALGAQKLRFHRVRNKRGPRLCAVATAQPPSSAAAGGRSLNNPSSSDPWSGYLFLDNGQVLRMPKRRAEIVPAFELSREQVVQIHLQAFKQNDEPEPDHGIEVGYRFANFDPWERSVYFGRKRDLGQFERFRRVMHSEPYSTLLCHEEAHIESSLEVSEDRWVQRVRVVGSNYRKERMYEFTLVQRLGGRFDGFWFVESLICDGEDFEGGNSAPIV